MLKTLCIVTFTVIAGSVFSEEPKPAPPVPSPIQPPVVTTTPVVPKPVASPQLPVTQTITRPTLPPMNIPRPQNQEWLALLERLRILPRAGEINNGTVNATLADIFSDSAEAKTKSSAIAADYEKVLLEKSAKWENEIKELRSQYETKMLAELPEARREAAQKFLDLSRTKWVEAAARDSKTRADFLERMRNSARPQPPGFKPVAVNGQLPNAQANPAAQPMADAQAWMREERMKAIKQDEETATSLRTMLSAEDAVRFDKFNRVRSVAVPGPTATPPITATNPLNAAAVPPASKPNNAIPAPSNPLEIPKDSAPEKK